MKSRIKEWIVRSDLTNDEVAAKLSVSRESVSKWCNNKAVPSLENAYKLSVLFKCKVEDLYFYNAENFFK
jgi:putative transcriptional regulator